MGDNQGRRDGEGRIESHNQRPRAEDRGDPSGNSSSSGKTQSEQLGDKVKDSVEEIFRVTTQEGWFVTNQYVTFSQMSAQPSVQNITH